MDGIPNQRSGGQPILPVYRVFIQYLAKKPAGSKEEPAGFLALMAKID